MTPPREWSCAEFGQDTRALDKMANARRLDDYCGCGAHLDIHYVGEMELHCDAVPCHCDETLCHPCQQKYLRGER
jgi:hypothetical protein